MIFLNYEKIELDENSLKLIEVAWSKEAARETDLFLVDYLSDGLKVKAYFCLPKKIEKKLPVILWLRGGYADNGAINRFNAKGIFGYLASHNFAVLAPQYRGAMGSEGLDEFGGGDLNDINNLISFANQIEFLDFDKLAVVGWSRGGMMTFLLLKNFPFRPKAVAVVGALTNLYSIENDRVVASRKLLKKIYQNLSDEEIEILLRERSAINFVDKLPNNVEYFLIHGAKDERISIYDALDMYREMLKNNLAARFFSFENGDHFLKGYRKEIDFILIDWLKKKLNLQ